MMEEMGKLLFFLSGSISTSLIGSFGSCGCSFSPHLFRLGSFHPFNPTLSLPGLSYRNGFVCFPTITSHDREPEWNLLGLGTVITIWESANVSGC